MIKYVHIILPSSSTAQVLNYLHQLVRFSLIEEWLADPEGGNGQGGKIRWKMGSPRTSNGAWLNGKKWYKWWICYFDVWLPEGKPMLQE